MKKLLKLVMIIIVIRHGRGIYREMHNSFYAVKGIVQRLSSCDSAEELFREIGFSNDEIGGGLKVLSEAEIFVILRDKTVV
ncbi:MAG: hypothetical protein IKO47_13250 [Ruminococcus sp.]|nr:hypothetical protein [Ruminococcus sp.]